MNEDNIRERADKLIRSIQNRAWKVAAVAGIPRDMCCLHNASIDDKMTGWAKDNPGLLKAAKRATAMIDGSWGISDLAGRVWRRSYNKNVGPSWAKYEVRPGRQINKNLLFAQP